MRALIREVPTDWNREAASEAHIAPAKGCPVGPRVDDLGCRFLLSICTACDFGRQNKHGRTRPRSHVAGIGRVLGSSALVRDPGWSVAAARSGALGRFFPG